MSQKPSKTGKKNRKWGRGLRKPSHQRYNSENRREKNKARKKARLEKILARKLSRKAKR